MRSPETKQLQRKPLKIKTVSPECLCAFVWMYKVGYQIKGEEKKTLRIKLSFFNLFCLLQFIFSFFTRSCSWFYSYNFHHHHHRRIMIFFSFLKKPLLCVFPFMLVVVVDAYVYVIRCWLSLVWCLYEISFLFLQIFYSNKQKRYWN